MNSQLALLFKRCTPILCGVGAIFLLFLASLIDHRLLIIIVQSFGVIITFGIFAVTWNHRQSLGNNYLLFIGIACLFIGGLELAYLATYQRDVVLKFAGVNTSVRLLIMVYYLQAASFLAASFFAKKHFNLYAVFGGYFAVFLFIFVLIFFWKVFPVFLFPNDNIPFFIAVNSFIIFLIYIAAIVLLRKNRESFDSKIFKRIDDALFVAAVGEMVFVFFGLTEAGSRHGLIGVLLNIVSNYLIFRTVVGMDFGGPYNFLLRHLVQSQERYGALVEYSSEAIVVFTDGIFVYTNTAGLKLFGAQKQKELLGKKALDFIHPEYRGLVSEYAQAIRAGEKIGSLKEFKIIRLDGSERYVEAVAGIINYEKKRSTQVMIRDITDRKQKESELKRVSEFNQILLNTIPYAMDIVDKDGNIIFVSKNLEKKFGPEIIGRKCWEMYKDDRRQCGQCPLKKGINMGESREMEITGVFGGKVFKVIHTGISFQNSKAVMEIFRDITEQKSAEKVIEDARTYAESIVNTIRDPLVVLDEDMKIVSANWAFYYFFHFERERSENGLFFEIYNKYWSIPGLKENIEKVVKDNIPIYNFEVSSNFPGVGERVMSFNILRIYQVNERSRKFLVSINDITEKKRSEERIRQSEEKYRNIFDNASDAIATVSLEDNITSWNRSAEAMFGWRRDEVIGKKFGALVVPQDFYSERGYLLKEAFSGKNRTGIETVRMRKDRTKINVSLAISPIYNEKREITGVSGIFRDITEQKKDEAKLKLHAEELEKLTNDLLKFQLAVEHASDLTVITDKDGVVLYANRAATGITGYPMAEIIGGKAGALWGRQMDRKFYQNFWDTVKKEKKIFIGEVLNKRKSGEKYYAEMRVSPITNAAGDVIFFVGLERDITKEKEIDKAKTEFVSITSHELRTPLANMSLTVEMILDAIAGPLNPEQKKYLRGIYRDIKGMADLVDALLNVSRIELRTLVVAPEPASLYEIAENVLKGIIPQVNRKGLKVVKIFDSALPVINIDRNLMRIILQNLLLNAVKYTPGGGKIGIEIRKDADDALIRVFDNGCGVPKDQQGKLFEKLFRARNAIDQRIEGVGLGLYIVKSIVVQCGGKIWFESEEDRGTIIFVRIPLEGMKKNG